MYGAAGRGQRQPEVAVGGEDLGAEDLWSGTDPQAALDVDRVDPDAGRDSLQEDALTEVDLEAVDLAVDRVELAVLDADRTFRPKSGSCSIPGIPSRADRREPSGTVVLEAQVRQLNLSASSPVVTSIARLVDDQSRVVVERRVRSSLAPGSCGGMCIVSADRRLAVVGELHLGLAGDV